MKTYLSPDAIKNFSISADKLSNTIVFKFFQTIDENNSIFLPDENFKEHNWEVIQKFNESYIYGNGSTDIYYITLLCPKEEEWHTATHERYTGQIRISDDLVFGLMFNDYPLMPEPDVIRYKGIATDLEVWLQETNNDELFETFSDYLFIKVTDFEVPTNNYLNSYIPKFANDLTGRIEATPEAFTYRPSAGQKSIRDDSAIIKSIKGNTIVWNQIFKLPKLDGASSMLSNTTDEGIVNGMRRIVSTDGTAQTLRIQDLVSSPSVIKGHKYYIAVTMNTDGNTVDWTLNGAFPATQVVSTPSVKKRYDIISTATESRGTAFQVRALRATFMEATNQIFIDLTKMFGAGNEPSTVEEFRALFPNEYYEYNAGEFRSLSADGIKTTGFNQWDEKWELGVYSESLGTKQPATNTICNVNRIQVLPNTVYNIKHPKATNLLAYIYFYDFDGNYINRKAVNSGTFTTPENCGYINFFMTSAYGVKYNNDICINLSHTNYRNGEYESYKEFTRELDVIKKYFPDGMKSAGTAYDEITSTKAITRIGIVDLGELSWGISADGTLLYSTHWGVEINGKSGINVFCQKYDAYSYVSAVTKDKTISLQVGYTQSGKTSIMVRDSAYTDAAAFKTAMSGVMLYYELAEPIEVEFDEVVDLTYNVYDFGTEEIFSSVPTTQFRGDIVYQFNATDTIRQNKNNIEIISDKLEVTELPNGNINVKGLGNFMSATPSGNPQHNLFVKAGAVYNEDSGFWEVNGKTDITNDEMETMYLEAYLTRSGNNLTNWFINSNSRTNLCLAYHNQAVALNSVFAMCYNLEVATLGTSAECLPTNISSLFYLCKKLQTCTTIINAQYLTSANDAFKQCYALTDIRIKNLGIDIVLIDSPLLNKISILYLIDNVNPDKNVKIKVNGDVKTLCDTDPDIQSSLSAHTNVTIE